MNRSFKSVWSPALGAWVAVSELTRAQGKRCSAGAAAMAVPALLAVLAGGAQAQNVTLAGTNGRLTYSTPCDTLTVASTCASELRFVQPNSSGATLALSSPLMVGANLSNINTGPAVSGTFSITNGGVATGGRLYIGYEGGTTGTVTVDGAGSSWNAGTGTKGTISVGNYGDGTMTLSNGGYVRGSNIYTGNYAGSTGVTTITGISGTKRSTLVATSYLFIGDNNDTVDKGVTLLPAGKGTVTVANGGLIQSVGGSIGGRTGTGHATITGVNGTQASEWKMTGAFTVGATSTGTLDILNGGSVSNGPGSIGSSAGSNGTVTVSGVNGAKPSTWVSSSVLYVGSQGSGTLNVLAGAKVSAGSVSIAVLAGSVGTATVSGTGSTLTTADSVAIGSNSGSTGVLTVSNDGVINAGSTSAYTGAALNIGGTVGGPAAASGTLNSPTLSLQGGALNFNHTGSAYTLATAISGTIAGRVNQVAGNTNLTGASAGFRGTTNVTGGKLSVNGTLGSATSVLNVSNGATLAGAGTIGGSVAVGDGHLSPGNSPGTLTINGNLALSSGSQLDYELGAANVAGGALNDLTVVKGNLTLDGTLNVTQSAGGVYGAGIYRVIDYSGTLTNTGLELGNMPAGTDNYIQTSVAQQVNLVNSKGLTLNFWDGDAGVKNDGTIAGGNGTWLAGPTGTDRWTQADGKINAPYQDGAFAVFQGAAGTVNVDNSLGPVRVSGMQFATDGYRIQGGDVELTPGTNAIRVGDGTAAGAATTATIASALTGAGRLDKVDLGTLVLSGTNTYTGGTAISGGTLQLGEGGTSGTLVGDVANNGTLAFNRSDAVSFGGAITGTGAVTQMGAGTTTLTGTNTYSGGTLISGGTLRGAIGNLGTGVITDNAALVIDQPADASFANAINGTGSLVKTGAGSLTLSGTNLLSGPTSVAQGMLAVTGSLANSAVTVLNGGTLAGTGTVGATSVQMGGTVAPGSNGIGTLSVNGNYAQASGGIYQVQVDPSTPSTSDRIGVSGTASLAGGSVLNVARTNGGVFTVGNKYTVLSATGGVSGTYALSGDTRTAFVQVSDSYDANNVYLTAEQVKTFQEVGITPNQIATAGGLQTLGNDNALRNAIAWLPSEVAARAAFDQLSGEIHASAKTALLENSRFVREAANDRLLGAFCAPGASDQTQQPRGTSPRLADGACAPATENVAWARVFGSTGRIDGDGNASRLKRDIGGFFVGADTAVAGGWRVGGLAGYSRASFDAANSHGKTDYYHLGVYGGNQWGRTALRLGASYTWHKLDTQRSVGFSGYADSLSAKYDGATAQVFGEVGQRFDVGNGMAVEPFAGLAYVNVKTDGFQERGGLAALTGSGGTLDSTFSTLGARFTAQLTADTALRGMLGWRHAFGDSTPTSTHNFTGSLPFTVYGVPIAKNVGVIEAGVETRLRKDLKLSATYSGQFGSGLKDNGVKVSLDWKF